MDDAAFAIWRADIVLLTATQRSLAFFELASAEANNPIDPFDQEEDAKTARPNAISGASDAVAPSGASSAVAPAAESDLLSQVGRKSNREFRLPSLSRGFDWPLGQGEWHASVPLQGMPQDIRSAHGDAVGRIAPQRTMDGSGASSDERRIDR
jgi:hypothetical protein